ncbi:hypothetical protein LTR62_004404 [Meristemomyces frigidus]|uniref:Protein transport protein BOS1 n=1 Tax=Meristemomyces frigidus TaxID=1508187 RepID=A0AAN7YG90_9PEZI|nr:hypothetical protein LTR62_004404 [Meristemomyces frigidus]
MSALYNSALRQSKSIRADLSAFAAPETSTPATQGQLTTSLTSFARTLDSYQKNVDLELVPDKAEKGQARLQKFREELLEFRARYAELKHENEQAAYAENRGELFAGRERKGYTAGGGGGNETPENPYRDAAVAAGGATGQNINPLFRTTNPNFQPGANGSNSYSSYQSPYGLGGDEQRESHALKENSFFTSANSTLDEYLERGRAVLGDLGEQREVLKGTQKKLYNIGNTLGISGDTIRMVERRAKQDKWIFWGGVVVFVVFVYFVIRWLR